jgi:putative two-component system response regulator
MAERPALTANTRGPMSARILATDDRPEVLRLIDRTLGERYSCDFAASIEEARERLAAATYDLALCDIQKPGEPGLVLAEEIVRGEADTAVVLVTGEDDPRMAERAFDIKAHGYLVKPFWPGQLLITVMNALRRLELEVAQRAHTRTLEQRLQMIMDRAPVPIYVKDRERRYVIANRVAHEVAGMAPNELIGLTDEAIMSAQGERTAGQSDRQILEQGGSYTAEETIQVGAEERTFLTVKFPFIDDSGSISGVAGISTDVTAKKQAEELREELAREQARAIEDLRASRQETVERLVRAIELHDPSTGEHVSRMASVAAFLGRQLGLSPERVELLRVAAPMHDVGKIATSDEILCKPGGLTVQERTEMERHTMVGYEILAGADGELLQLAATIALTHHERFDGEGYPQQLKGTEIPLEGRITALADVLDALLSERAYRPALAVEEAIAVIREGRGTHFDPEVLDALLDNLDEALALRS